MLRGVYRRHSCKTGKYLGQLDRNLRSLAGTVSCVTPPARLPGEAGAAPSASPLIHSARVRGGSGTGDTGLKTRQSPCPHRMFQWGLRKASEHATRSPAVTDTMKKNAGIKNTGLYGRGLTSQLVTSSEQTFQFSEGAGHTTNWGKNIPGRGPQADVSFVRWR